MNILILTPDAVGSTLLQRLITIYMQFYDYDKPVINLHELTNGLEKYWSPEFNREIVSKKQVPNWSYYQSLSEIVEILASVDHYKTSRLARYHITRRQDPISQQIPFYQYLDENFYVIACRRDNVFEHALSHAINNITKKLNVYGHHEKIATFLDMYIDPVTLDEQVLHDKLIAYQDYINWSSDHFNVGSYFHYDRDLDRIEDFILDLPIWPSNNIKMTWQEKFGLQFNDWNRCHHIPSDLGSIAESGERMCQILVDRTTGITEETVRLYQQRALPEWPAVHSVSDLERLPTTVKSEFSTLIKSKPLDFASHQVRKFMAHHASAYQRAQSAIERMQELDIIVSPPPIKKQTLREKMSIVKNIDRCLEIYNQWIVQNPALGKPLSREDLEIQALAENAFWRCLKTPDDGKSDQLSIGM